MRSALWTMPARVSAHTNVMEVVPSATNSAACDSRDSRRSDLLFVGAVTSVYSSAPCIESIYVSSAESSIFWGLSEILCESWLH